MLEEIKFGAAISDYQHFGNKYSNLPPIESSLHEKLYKEDMKIARDIGLQILRTQIEWSKIETEEGKINDYYREFYHKYFKTIKENNIELMLTLWHFTFPKWIEKYDLSSKEFGEKFLKYVEFVSREYGKYVDYWIILNEPSSYITSYFFSGKNIHYRYKVLRNFFKIVDESAKIIKKYNPKAKISIAYNAFVPSNNKNIFSKLLEKLDEIILKRFSRSLDFIGLNYYCSYDIKLIPPYVSSKPLVNPIALKEKLIKISKLGKPIIITENGISGNDDEKINYFVEHLNSILDSNCNVIAYIWWSFLHGYEWFCGYDFNFSIVDVDMKTKERRLTKFGKFYSKVIKERKIPNFEKIDLKKFNNWPYTYYTGKI